MSCPHLTLPGDMQCETCHLRAALATVTAERDSLRSTGRKLHDALTLANEQHSELCREFHAERAAHAETRKALDVSLANELMLKNACAARNAELELARENASDQEAELFDSINELEMQLESAHSAHAETRAALERQDRAVLSFHAALESTRAELARSEAQVKAATGALTNVYIMSSQDAGQVVCASVVYDALALLTAPTGERGKT